MASEPGQPLPSSFTLQPRKDLSKALLFFCKTYMNRSNFTRSAKVHYKCFTFPCVGFSFLLFLAIVLHFKLPTLEKSTCWSWLPWVDYPDPNLDVESNFISIVFDYSQIKKDTHEFITIFFYGACLKVTVCALTGEVISQYNFFEEQFGKYVKCLLRVHILWQGNFSFREFLLRKLSVMIICRVVW